MTALANNGRSMLHKHVHLPPLSLDENRLLSHRNSLKHNYRLTDVVYSISLHYIVFLSLSKNHVSHWFVRSLRGNKLCLRTHIQSYSNLCIFPDRYRGIVLETSGYMGIEGKNSMIFPTPMRHENSQIRRFPLFKVRRSNVLIEPEISIAKRQWGNRESTLT